MLFVEMEVATMERSQGLQRESALKMAEQQSFEEMNSSKDAGGSCDQRWPRA